MQLFQTYLLTFTFICAALLHGSQRPNLIIILTDDQGYNDVGFNGCTDIPTPHLDKLAASGVVFTNGYVS
ncbi:MAG: sulfatase-like hydrolase/transferase, partial [Puniceicoccaceae bacterium]|nr:sulfatase-like hydrolase/transferase [Puniceicoccaceae bacterium]